MTLSMKVYNSTSDNMDRCYSRGGKSQKRKEEKRRSEKRRQKKDDHGAPQGRRVATRCVFSNVFGLQRVEKQAC